LELKEEKSALQDLYKKVEIKAINIDPTLKKHVRSLCNQSLQRLEALEKKMLKAERKKFDAGQRQLQKIKSQLFPGGILQERVDNVLPYYAKWGHGFIDELYKFSTGFEQAFCIMEEGDEM
ncbi:MAG TPA: bacillithiol biosynthesis BshC, partial [Ferruginibacter sp.]|nr:bacillithiol biosynthesis BshC [Ferruginibacter sp.]